MTYYKILAVANKDAGSVAEAYNYVIIIGLTVSTYNLTILRHSLCDSSTDMATIREENCSLSRTPYHLAVVTASGAQKNKVSLQRHSSLPMLSFDTEVEELNLETRADTMMTALSPPSSCSITNGVIW